MGRGRRIWGLTLSPVGYVYVKMIFVKHCFQDGLELKGLHLLAFEIKQVW